jgi:hypothetical protein
MNMPVLSRSAPDATTMEPSRPIEAVISATATKVTYTGSGGVVIGALTYSDFTVLVGLVLAIGGFIVNWYYKSKQTRTEIHLLHEKNDREREAHEARMTEYREAAKLSRADQ